MWNVKQDKKMSVEECWRQVEQQRGYKPIETSRVMQYIWLLKTSVLSKAPKRLNDVSDIWLPSYIPMNRKSYVGSTSTTSLFEFYFEMKISCIQIQGSNPAKVNAMAWQQRCVSVIQFLYIILKWKCIVYMFLFLCIYGYYNDIHISYIIKKHIHIIE